MDIPDSDNDKDIKLEHVSPPPIPTKPLLSSDLTDLDTWTRFFRLTGGSIFYCLSAIFVAYGIVKVMGPILSTSDTIKDALPCIFTLHLYEIALLAVLILIVSRKVVDDAVSIVILMALFLVGTSIALGSVIDKGIEKGFIIALIGIAIAFGKFLFMKRFARINFRSLSILGLTLLMACNYLGPVLMARSISTDPSQELIRRNLWMLIWVSMLAAVCIVLLEAMTQKDPRPPYNARPFLHRPVMVYIFALLLLIISGVHQYSMSYTFALERVWGDYVPLLTLATLLAIQILRLDGKLFGYTEIFISCLPLTAMLFALDDKTVIASGRLGFDLICYPPVFFALSGLALAALALYHRWYRLLLVVFFYGLGVVLTFGFSPEHPYDLNIRATALTLIIALLIYGLVTRNQFAYIAGLFILCLALTRVDSFSVFAKNLNTTVPGSICGVFGLGCLTFYLLFGKLLHKTFWLLGTLCLAVFIFDCLPNYIYWSYLIVLPLAVCVMILLWLLRKDTLALVILCAPFMAKLYILAKRLANWRFVILGFLLLAAGAVFSLLKRPARQHPDEDNKP